MNNVINFGEYRSYCPPRLEAPGSLKQDIENILIAFAKLSGAKTIELNIAEDYALIIMDTIGDDFE